MAGLLFAGFYMMARSFVPDLRPLSGLGFVRRPGAAEEFGRGLALGWGIAIALVLPALLTGNLGLSFNWDSAALVRTLLSATVLVVFALAVQLVLAGLPVRLLVRAAGPAWTTAAILFLAACTSLTAPEGQGRSTLYSVLAISLFATAFLRTRAAWFSLGLQIGLTVVLQLLFGATSPYTPPAYGIVQSDTGGATWLTGDGFGPEASWFAIIVMIVALVVLFRITRTYAWHYTYEPIEGAGYPMDVPPPAEHVREEQKAAAAAPLVQIQMPGSAAPERSAADTGDSDPSSHS
jgi:hypothetical protein